MQPGAGLPPRGGRSRLRLRQMGRSCTHPEPVMTEQPEGEPHDRGRDLDPADWSNFRRLAHAALDDVITHIVTIRDRAVWQAAPAAVRDHFAQPLPHAERALTDVLDNVRAHVFPYATGNLHPGFMGWVHGAGTPVGMLAEMIAGGLNMN